MSTTQPSAYTHLAATTGLFANHFVFGGEQYNETTDTFEFKPIENHIVRIDNETGQDTFELEKDLGSTGVNLAGGVFSRLNDTEMRKYWACNTEDTSDFDGLEWVYNMTLVALAMTGSAPTQSPTYSPTS